MSLAVLLPLLLLLLLLLLVSGSNALAAFSLELTACRTFAMDGRKNDVARSNLCPCLAPLPPPAKLPKRPPPAAKLLTQRG
eukprot:CAMPEP_0172861808 /NCGR_PEP_ID=MMETSP1075-20121228/72866_1 /TAXON_ID=2916 /ORGANISM="Ceratium fusus, Strain PA161109" /LENGTH=80 /DNA_ID=CAMNT_0013709989 /DNA_START=94 /DNA_END=332 /DNA_ORIENTATION=-